MTIAGGAADAIRLLVRLRCWSTAAQQLLSFRRRLPRRDEQLPLTVQKKSYSGLSEGRKDPVEGSDFDFTHEKNLKV